MEAFSLFTGLNIEKNYTDHRDVFHIMFHLNAFLEIFLRNGVRTYTTYRYLIVSDILLNDSELYINNLLLCNMLKAERSSIFI